MFTGPRFGGRSVVMKGRGVMVRVREEKGGEWGDQLEGVRRGQTN